MNIDYMLDKISDASTYIFQLNTLINEISYDKQEQFIKSLKSIKYDLDIIELLIKQEKRTEEMKQKLLNLCNTFSGCDKCPLSKLRKIRCAVSNYGSLCKLKTEEVVELYNAVEEWIKNFRLDD